MDQQQDDVIYLDISLVISTIFKKLLITLPISLIASAGIYFFLIGLKPQFGYSYLVELPRITPPGINAASAESLLLGSLGGVSSNETDQGAYVERMIEFKYDIKMKFFDPVPFVKDIKLGEGDKLFELEIQAGSIEEAKKYGDLILDDVTKQIDSTIGLVKNQYKQGMTLITDQLTRVNGSISQIENNIKKLGMSPVLMEQLAKLNSEKVQFEKQYYIFSQDTSILYLKNIEILHQKPTDSEQVFPKTTLFTLLAFIVIFSSLNFLFILVKFYKS